MGGSPWFPAVAEFAEGPDVFGFVKAGKNRAELVFSAAKASACCPQAGYWHASQTFQRRFYKDFYKSQ